MDVGGGDGSFLLAAAAQAPALRLRLFDLSGEQSIEIEPTHDSLLVFPSSARHEVEEISCPGGAFADSRFAINIWLCG